MADESTPSKLVLPPLSHTSPPAEDWNDGDFDFDDGDDSALANLRDTSDRGDASRPPSAASHVASDMDAIADNELSCATPVQGFGALSQGGVDEDEEAWDKELEDDEDHLDTIKLSNLGDATLADLRVASASARAASALKSSTAPQEFTGAITCLNSQSLAGGSGKVTRVDGDWDEDIEMPDLLASHPSERYDDIFASELDLDHFVDSGTSPRTGTISAATSTSNFTALSLGSRESAASDTYSTSASAKRSVGGPSTRTSYASLTGSSAPPLPIHRISSSSDLISTDAMGDAEEPLEDAFILDPQTQTLKLAHPMTQKPSHPTLNQERLLWTDSDQHDASSLSSSPDWRGSTPSLETSSQSPLRLRSSRELTRSPSTSASASAAESDLEARAGEDMSDGLVLPDSVFGPAGEAGEALKGEKRRSAGAALKLQAMIDDRLRGLLPTHIVGPEITKADSVPSSTDTMSSLDSDFASGLVITDDLDLSPARLKGKKLSFETRSQVRSLRQADASARQEWGARRRDASSASFALQIAQEHTRAGGPPKSIMPSSLQLAASAAVTAAARGSPPRAPSAYSHLQGAGPGRTLRAKQSAGNLLGSSSGRGGTTRSSHVRSNSLMRKRSLPVVGVDGTLVQGSSAAKDPLTNLRSGSAESLALSSAPPTTISRLTASTAASRARATPANTSKTGRATPTLPALSTTRAKMSDTLLTKRASSPSLLSRAGSSYSAITATAAAAKDAASRLMRRPRHARTCGDGHELDAFDDLPTGPRSEVRPGSRASNTSSSKDSTLKGNVAQAVAAKLRGKQSASSSKGGGPSGLRPSVIVCGSLGAEPVSASPPRKSGTRSRRPTLIRPLNSKPGESSSIARVVGDMRWNPERKRWEGNERVLRDFENALSSSVRPALISPIAAVFPVSSREPLGSPWRARRSGASSETVSVATPSSSLSGVRVVGDMVFDPVRMCWLNQGTQPEPDVFASMDTDDDGESQPSHTLSTAHLSAHHSILESLRHRQSSSALSIDSATSGERHKPPPLPGSGDSLPADDNEAGEDVEAAEARAAHDALIGEGGFVDESLRQACIDAERRHRRELRGFLPKGATLYNAAAPSETTSKRDHLYFLQRLAKQVGR